MLAGLISCKQNKTKTQAQQGRQCRGCACTPVHLRGCASNSSHHLPHTTRYHWRISTDVPARMETHPHSWRRARFQGGRDGRSHGGLDGRSHGGVAREGLAGCSHGGNTRKTPRPRDSMAPRIRGRNTTPETRGRSTSPETACWEPAATAPSARASPAPSLPPAEMPEATPTHEHAIKTSRAKYTAHQLESLLPRSCRLRDRPRK